MANFIIDGVKVETLAVDDITRAEAEKYVAYVQERVSEPIRAIRVIGLPDGTINLDYELQGPKFERIRRITGYLTRTLDSWNNAKRAEERERVKHGLDGVDFEEKNIYREQFASEAKGDGLIMPIGRD